MANITFEWSNLPVGYCWTGPQQFMNDIFSLLTGSMGAGVGLIVGDSIPSPDDQDKVWLRTNPDGTMEGIYKYQGAWHRPHPISASSLQFMIWKGTENDLWAYDGGDGTNPSINPPSDFTGAMWQRDTDMDFLMPVGIGTNPVSYNGDPATTINVGDTGGAEKVVLDLAESGADKHVHTTGRMSKDSGSGSDDGYFLTGNPAITNGNGRGISGDWDSNHTADISTLNGEYLVSAEAEIPPATDPATAHQNMPPYRGVIFARRTSRKFITVI